jgi:gliding motility-associated-like protein
VTLNISVNPILFAFDTITICENELPFNWNGLSLTESGTQSVLLSSALTGCDSLATLNLSLNTVLTSTTDVTLCDSELPYAWNGLSAESAGAYSVTFTSSITGCDSVAMLNLDIDLLEMPELISNSPVTCPKDMVDVSVLDIPGAQFYWVGPMGFTSSELSNAFELDYDNSGTYSIYYSLNSCLSETATIELGVQNVFDFKNFDFPNVITANGDGVNDEIDINQYIGQCEEFELTVRDRWGNQVYIQRRGDDGFDGNSILNEMLPEGVYFYNFTHSQGSSSGFIHLIK